MPASGTRAIAAARGAIATKVRHLDVIELGALEQSRELLNVLGAHLLFDAVGGHAGYRAAHVEARLVQRVAERLAGIPAHRVGDAHAIRLTRVVEALTQLPDAFARQALVERPQPVRLGHAPQAAAGEHVVVVDAKPAAREPIVDVAAETREVLLDCLVLAGRRRLACSPEQLCSHLACEIPRILVTGVAPTMVTSLSAAAVALIFVITGPIGWAGSRSRR